MKNILSTILLLALTGCSTIYFHRNTTQKARQYGEWHHDGLFGLVEFSDPVDLNSKCRGAQWKTVRTQQTFVQGLVGAITYQLYDPWDVAYTCVNSAAEPPQK